MRKQTEMAHCPRLRSAWHQLWNPGKIYSVRASVAVHLIACIPSLQTYSTIYNKMPSSSSKGKPTDQELHDKITEEVKQQTNKDGAFLRLSAGVSSGTRGIALSGNLFLPGRSVGRPLIISFRRQWQGSDGSLEV